MAEYIYAGTFESQQQIYKLMQLLFKSDCDSTYALLELVPEKYFTPQQRAEGLQFVRYKDMDTNLSWSKGRVFNTHGELRWERKENHFKVVYAGASNSTLDGQLEKIYSDCQSHGPQGYFLWGDYFKDREGNTKFFELQIPRLFEYPVSGNGVTRCKINIISYPDEEYSVYHYFRLHSVEEVSA